MSGVDPFACAAFLVVGVALAGLIHGAWLKSPVSHRFAIPLDGGRRFRGRRLLGDNKTVRGFMAIIPGAALSFAGLSLLLAGPGGELPAGLWQLTTAGYAALGAWAGLGFMLGELPNSFLKRQLGIEPGTPPRGRMAGLAAAAADRLDSAFGVLVAVSFVVATPAATWFWVLVLGPPVHAVFSMLLFRLGVKARAA